MTKIQIYTIQSVEEALELADLGIDHIGVTPASRGLPGEIDIKTAYSICKSVKDSLVTVALSVESDINLILSMVKEVKPQILHLCSPEGFITPQSIRDLKEKLYTNNIDIEIMQAISVKGFESVENAISFVDEVDYLICLL